MKSFLTPTRDWMGENNSRIEEGNHRSPLSPGESVRVSNQLNSGKVINFDVRTHHGLAKKLVSTTALSPALSPGEREKRLPRLGKLGASDCRIILASNKKTAVIETTTRKFFHVVNIYPLSPGERARVRASVKLNSSNQISPTRTTALKRNGAFTFSQPQLNFAP